MAATLVREAMLKITADDGDTEAKLQLISDKARELGEQHPDLKVRIETAAASAKLAVLREELKAVARDAEKDMVEADVMATEKGGSKGLFGKLFLGSSGDAGGLASGAGSGASSIAGDAAASGQGGAGIGAILAGILAAEAPTGLLGIVPVLASATLGVGAFAAVAYPQFSKISASMQQLQTDTQAYDRAQTKAARNTALKDIQKDWASMSGPQRDAVHGIQALEGSFDKIAHQMSPLVFKVFNDGLKIANQLLPFLAPLATAAGNAIDGLLKNMSKFVAGKGFADFMANMTHLAGPAITTIGEGIGQIIVALGKLILAFENPNMLRATADLFKAIAGIIAGLAWVFTHATPLIVSFYAWVARTFRDGVKDAKEFGSGVSSAISDVSAFIGRFVAGAARDWDSFVASIVSVVRRVQGDFDTVKHDVQLLWDAITGGGKPLKQVESDFRTFGNEVSHAVQAMGNYVISELAHLGAEAMHWLGSVISSAVDSAMSSFRSLPGKAGSAMSGMLSQVTSWGGKVEAWFKQLPGEVLSILNSLGAQMRSVGARIIEGLISGIESAAGALASSIRHIADIITSGLAGFLGIHSPSRVTQEMGRQIGAGLVAGMAESAGAVQSGARRLAVAATPGGVSTAGPPGSAFQLQVTGGADEFSQFMARFIKNYVRTVGGGSVQAAFGRGTG